MLKSYGIDEAGLKELKLEAKNLLGTAESVQTDFGLVQSVPKKPVQWKVRRVPRTEDIFPDRTIILVRNE